MLDEAGMADTRHAEQLLARARQARVKVVAIGDSGQLPSVQAGGWLRAVGDQVGRHEITETRRQKNVAERRALGALHAGVPQVWLDFAAKNDRLVVCSEDERAIAHAIDAWTGAVAEHGVDQAVLIARDNAMRSLLNAGARRHWDEQGRLGKRIDFGPIEVAEGDRVICRRNDARHDVDNGTRGTIRAVGEGHVLLEVNGGVVRELPASYVAEHVEHAYALTGHGMQGSTVKWAGVVATPEHLTRGWSYTALSRAEETTMLFVSDEGPERDPNLEQEGPELARERDHSTTLWRIGERMTVRDDEDLAIERLPDPVVGAGRAGDRDVVDAPDSETPIQERGAEPMPAPIARGGAQRELVALQAADDRLALQQQALPVRELEQLDAIAGEHKELLARRAQHAERLAAVPPPPSSAATSMPANAATSKRSSQATTSALQQCTAPPSRSESPSAHRPAVTPAKSATNCAASTLAATRSPRNSACGARSWQPKPSRGRQCVVEQTLGRRPADGDRALGAWKKAIRTVTDTQLQIDPERPLDAGLRRRPRAAASCTAGDARRRRSRTHSATDRSHARALPVAERADLPSDS